MGHVTYPPLNVILGTLWILEMERAGKISRTAKFELRIVKNWTGQQPIRVHDRLRIPDPDREKIKADSTANLYNPPVWTKRHQCAPSARSTGLGTLLAQSTQNVLRLLMWGSRDHQRRPCPPCSDGMELSAEERAHLANLKWSRRYFRKFRCLQQKDKNEGFTKPVTEPNLCKPLGYKLSAWIPQLQLYSCPADPRWVCTFQLYCLLCISPSRQNHRLQK